MAKKKVHHGKKVHHHHKKKRVGAIDLKSKDVMDALLFVVSVLAGKWAANIAATQAATAFTSIPANYMAWGTGAVEIGAGVYGFLDLKEPWQKGLALGVAINGGDVIEKQLGLVSGVMGYINLLPQGMGTAASYRPVPRLGTVAPDQFRQPKTVGRPNFRPNMTSVYAAGSGY